MKTQSDAPELKTTRIALKNILVCTDFSAASRPSLASAAALARSFGAKLYLVHSVPPVVMPVEAPMGLPAEPEIMDKLAHDQMQELRKSALLRGIRVESRILHGDIAQSIHPLAERISADLIVVGTHGSGALEKVLLGSVAEEVFRSSWRPVLTVGPHVSTHVARNARYDSVLFATDLSLQSLRAAQYAVSIAEEHKANLTLMHVVQQEPGGTMERMGLERYTIEELRQLVPAEAELWCQPSFQVAYGKPAEQILKTAHELHAKLIVMSVRKSTHIRSHVPWSTAFRVVQQARCPVLTVRYSH